MPSPLLCRQFRPDSPPSLLLQGLAFTKQEWKGCPWRQALPLYLGLPVWARFAESGGFRGTKNPGFGVHFCKSLTCGRLPCKATCGLCFVLFAYRWCMQRPSFLALTSQGAMHDVVRAAQNVFDLRDATANFCSVPSFQPLLQR